MLISAPGANTGRLRILTALAIEDGQDRLRLRTLTCLTDRTLDTDARQLCSAGLIDIDEENQRGHSALSYRLTPAGRTALQEHARKLLATVSATAP